MQLSVVAACRIGVPECPEVVSKLAAAGVIVEERAIESRIAIAFVGGADAETTRQLRELVVGCDRVLAIVVTQITPGDHVRLLDAGASDVIAWRDDAASAIASRLQRWEAIDRLLESAIVRDNLIGGGRSWQRLLRNVVEIAHYTSASILLAGESGTGKELVARLVHTLDTRADKGELIVVDCTTIVPTLSGSEFFGHERGAFTGAIGARDGAFALAHDGTLFLDEVADLSLPLQAQLLRVVQERTYKRVGGNDWQRADFRLVCASHRDLAAAVRRGEFRHDLYHRIATWTFTLPALAERREDIPALVHHFLRQARSEAIELDPVVEHFLTHREYPGNIRELRHVVQRLVDRCPGAGPITAGQITEAERCLLVDNPAWPDDDFEAAVRRAVAAGIGLKDLRRTAEDFAVRIALALESGSVAKASRRLGITERAIQLRQAARRDQSEDASN